MDRISALVRGMSDEEKTANRACFLHFMGSMAGSVVCTEMVEGRRVKGIFHTGTAFPGKDFLVCLKATRAEVSNIHFILFFIDFHNRFFHLKYRVKALMRSIWRLAPL